MRPTTSEKLASTEVGRTGFPRFRFRFLTVLSGERQGWRTRDSARTPLCKHRARIDRKRLGRFRPVSGSGDGRRAEFAYGARAVGSGIRQLLGHSVASPRQLSQQCCDSFSRTVAWLARVIVSAVLTLSSRCGNSRSRD
jgi:hypothetical protein